MTPETQILPCPFCGEQPEHYIHDRRDEDWMDNISCIGCDYTLKASAIAGDLVATWNTRTPAIADGVGVEWKQTVRDLYDMLHFGEQNAFNNQSLSKIVAFIEDRHQDYFLSPPQAATEYYLTIGDQKALRDAQRKSVKVIKTGTPQVATDEG